MRTLALLAALLLLALRGQAGPLAEPADRMTDAEDPLPAQAQYGDEDPLSAQAQDGAQDPLPAQAQDGAEDQAMTISFEGDERLARDIASPRRTLTCYCRRALCLPWERRLGTCHVDGGRHPFCCS